MAVVSYSLPSAISSIVFTCIATVLLLGFLCWRGIRLISICRGVPKFMPDPNGMESKDIYLKGKGIAAVKVLVVIGGLCLIGSSLYGIITISISSEYNANNVVQQGWYVLDVLVEYIASTIVTMRQLMYNLNQAGVTVNQIINLTNSSQCKYGTPIPSDVLDQAANITVQTYNLTYDAAQIADTIYKSIVETYVAGHNDWEDTTLSIWSYVVIGYLVLLALVLVGSVFFMASSWLNHTSGLSWTVPLHLVQALIFFILCIVFSFGLASLKESCYSAEGFIAASLPYPPAQDLAKFYLNSQSQIDTAPYLVLLDDRVSEIQHRMNDLQVSFNHHLKEQANLLPGCIPTLINLTNQLTIRLANITAILGSPAYPGSFAYLASLPVVQGNYGSTKTYLCCEVPSLLRRMYIILTAVGWFAMVISVISFFQLYCLDRIPQRLCCSCTVLRPFSPFGASSEVEYQVKGKQVDEEEAAPPIAELSMDRGDTGSSPVVRMVSQEWERSPDTEVARK